MPNENPAIPAQAAAPGSVAPVVPNPSAAAPAPQGDQGNQSEGKVTIDLKEYRDLQRAKARTLSFDKRQEFRKNNPASPTANGNGGGNQDDPELVAENNRLRTENESIKRTAMQAEVKAGVRDILAKPEFANLPESTKSLILKNPAMLSEADTVEEALLDIEDFVRENSVADPKLNQNQSGGGHSSQAAPPGHEAPPGASGGAPAPANAEGLEDTTNLKGAARSQAMIRNAVKKQRGVK